MTRITQIGGRPVFDAKRALVVNITRGDVTRSHETQEPDRCAMARACYRELQCYEVRVYISRTYVRMNDTNWLRYITSEPLRNQIIAMAEGLGFEPGEFTLLTPPPSKRSGYTPVKRGPRGTRRKPYVLSNVRARASSE